MAIKEILEQLGLPLELADSSFAATIRLIDVEWARKINSYFAYYGINIMKASELKYYTYNEEEIKFVLAKLQYCKNNNISVVDEQGNNKRYLFDLNKKNSEWISLYPDADLTTIIPDVLRDKETINADMLKSLDINATVGLTEETYDKYRDLESKLMLVMQTIYGVGEITPEVSNNLIKLISTNNSYSDADILFAVLVYNQNRSVEEIEAIKSAIKEVIESLNQGGSREL